MFIQTIGVLCVLIPKIMGYGYGFMPYGMPYGGMSYPMNPYAMNPMGPMQNPYAQGPPRMNPYMTPNPNPNPYQGYNPMPFYPTYVQNYGMIPTEIIDEPSSKELVDPKVKVLIPNSSSSSQNVTKIIGSNPQGPKLANPALQKPIGTQFINSGPQGMFPPSSGPYGYMPRPAFKVNGINSTNDVKSSFSGPVMTSSISKSQPSQTIITRTLDPKTGDAKVDIKTDAQKMDDSKNQTDIRVPVKFPIYGRPTSLKGDDSKNGTRSRQPFTVQKKLVAKKD